MLKAQKILAALNLSPAHRQSPARLCYHNPQFAITKTLTKIQMTCCSTSAMAISSSLGLPCRPHFRLRSSYLRCPHKIRVSWTAAKAGAELDYELKRVSNLNISDDRDVVNDRKVPEWKKLSTKDLGITSSLISKPTRIVLNALKKKGFDVYLVGGCVRDLILKRTPKDFDILTSAELKEVMRTFSWCQIVGRRFPICHVHIDDTIIEVSSFSTSAAMSMGHSIFSVEKPAGCDEKDYVRWKNCLRRDFTINGLMLDPYAKLIYDYLGGVEDIRKAKVRTVTPASLSLQEDCARILRGIRIAARLGFGFSRETSRFVKSFASSVLGLDKGRILMEIDYMLAYGSAEASLRLLWKFGLLDILLPIQAAYFVSNGFKRRDKRSNMLLSLFFNLDKLLAPDRPCHSSLWVAILAFHEALTDQARDPVVVAAFSLAVHNGGDLSEALNIARRISKQHDCGHNELLEPQNMDYEALKKEVMHLSKSVARALSNMTDEYYISQAMAKYPNAPYSDLVYIPLVLYLRVSKIFECVAGGRQSNFIPKQGTKINYESLAIGTLQEVRHVFARIVFDTVYPTDLISNQSGE